MEEFLDSELSCNDFVIDLKLAKEIVSEVIGGIGRICERKRSIWLLKALEMWKAQVFDDFGGGVWMKVLKGVVEKMIKNFKRLQGAIISKGFYRWKEVVKEIREEVKFRNLNEEAEFEYQREIKELEIRINELQIRNEELNKVHGHFANREVIYCRKISELKCKTNDLKITPNIEELILTFEDQNNELHYKVQASEYLLKQFLTSTKSLIPD